MSKIILLFAIVVLVFAAVEAQTRRNPICQRQDERCLRNERRNARRQDISDIFNEWCRQSDRRWRSISRCELTRATCHLTLEKCSTLSCANVRRALMGERTPTTTERSGPGEE